MRNDAWRRHVVAGLALVVGLSTSLPAGAQLPVPAAPPAPLPEPTAARLRAGAAVPAPPVLAVGGGEVVLDLTIGPDGGVTAVTPVRATPPFTDLVAGAVGGWRFDPARTLVKRALQATEGHVLVMAVFRPPQVYASPAPGEPTEMVGKVNPELPAPGALSLPLSYPPRAVRDGAVLIEIELTAAGVPTAHLVMSPPSAFDSAALETVRTWRFDFPTKPTGATRLFAYAIVGFREPITQPAAAPAPGGV